jgi:sodium transport system permease protein
MLKGICLIFRKEIWIALRERRTLIFLLLFPLLVWPVFVVLPWLLIGGKEQRAEAQPSKVALVSAYPELEKEFEASDELQLVQLEDSAAAALQQRKAHSVVYVDSLSSDSLVTYARILYDPTQAESRAAADKVELVLSQYERKIVIERLAQQGVPERMLKALSYRRENAMGQNQMLGYYLGLIIGMFVVMGSMMGSSAVVIDSTAGEKERKTLELLLTVPIPRRAIMMGKYLAGVTFAFISPILTALGMSLAASFVVPVLVSSGGSVDLSGLISPGKILIILLVVLLMAAFIAALQMTVAVRAHSNRQAQTYLAPLNIIVVIPVIFLQIIPALPPNWMFFIPFVNVMLLLRGLLMDTLPGSAVLYTFVSNFVFLMLTLRFAARAFGSEKVLLN